ncbi:DctP family TRAP transporter solute-binding subunit [Cryobacterium psychrophilum]|uniref:DctP family TRAP transporter solute-binding subunit n=1 Tax=Cryobacterium psychrophilum TaxID=41988 RepID=A0A4Y8KU96_9MICO|nr:DctP family TRAP transporter solute-binding subunit [Cryobacterium psychrophilum]TDW29524.1 tripartite ATP-independent transporter DctP family solute receptor [Cryobacterium psychrophilum]TFD81662.1 DctP family TRAP transporter solute-binding subunit [Cryobacterium psychrophilum]
MKNRRFGLVVVAAAAAGALGLSGCSSASADQEERVLRFSHAYEATHPFETCGVPALNNGLEGSGLRVESYPSAQLANDSESLEQVSMGTLDFAISGGSFLGTWYDPMAVLDAGYLFDDAEHFRESANNGAFDELFGQLESDTGLKIQSSWYYGARHMTANKPLDSPSDLAGLKIRTPDAPMFMRNIELLGGVGTPMALGEVYLGLQQGVIDAQENPIPTIAASKLNEVQDYINLTGHMVQGLFVVSNANLEDSLTDEQNEALDAAFDTASESVYDCIVSAEEETLAEWKNDGSINVHVPSGLDEMKKTVQEHWSADPVYGDFYNSIREGR